MSTILGKFLFGSGTYRAIRRSLVTMSIAALGIVFWGRAASAQLTTEALIGSAVSEVGPRFSDVDEAITHFRNGDVTTARFYLDRAKEKNPELPPTEVTLAKMYMAAKNQNAAEATLEQAIAKYPDDPEPYLLFAEDEMRNGRLTVAELVYAKAQKAVDSYDQNAKRKRNLAIRSLAGPAQAAMNQKDWETAKTRLKAWLELEPDKSGVMRLLAQANFMTDDAREAFQLLSKATEVDKNLPSPYAMIGQMYAQEGNVDNANKSFERAISESGANEATRMLAAQWYMQQGDLRKAQTQLDAVLKSNPESVTALLLRGMVSRLTGDAKQAEDYYSKAHLLAPDAWEPTNQLALLLIMQEDKEQRERALRFARANNRLFSDNGNAGVTYAWVLHNYNRDNDALRMLGEAIKRPNLDLDSNYFAAKILAERGQRSDRANAMRILKSALDNKGIFVERKNAQELLDKLQSESG